MNQITSEDFADLIIENELISLYENVAKDNITFINSQHSLANIPSSEIEKCSLGVFNYHVFPSCFILSNLDSLEQSGIVQIQNNPNFGLFGEGVLIGIVDTGIDYQHEAFLNADKTSRIISIWDQTIDNTETLTVEIPYGKVFENEMINTAINSEDPLSIVPTVDEIGHGTMVAGVVAGTRNEARKFSGVVPKSELVVVKLKQAKKITREVFSIPEAAICFQDTDILMGVRYVFGIASKLKRPMAILVGLGTNQGGHNGRGAVSTYLNEITENPRMCVVTTAGNEGISRRHFMGKLNKEDETKEFELNVASADTLFAMEVWQQAPYRIAIDITSPTGEYTAPIYPEIGICRKLNYIFESSVLWVNNNLIESETGDQVILIRFQTPLAGIWKFRVYNIDKAVSQFNVWLPAGDLISNQTYFLESDPNMTTTSPGNAALPIVITSYNTATGGIQITASRGYTRSNVIKPDLAAPGVDLTCPMPNNRYGTISGTSAAAAHTTGIAAMLLEWGIVKGRYINMNGQNIKQLLIRGAKRSEDLIYPNNIWGFGKVDIFTVFQRLR